MAEEKTQEQTYTQAQVDEAVKAAKAGQDRFVANIQEGKELPKWVKDAGYDSTDKALAALKRPATVEQPKAIPEFDESKYLDDDGRMTSEGRKAERSYLAEIARREAQELWLANQNAAMADAERSHIEDAAAKAPELMKPNGDDDNVFVASLVDGLCSRSLGTKIASPKDVAEQTGRAVDYFTRAVDAEIARRVAKAKAESDSEAPAGRPAGGDGQPRGGGSSSEQQPKTHQERVARAREASQRTFVGRSAE